MFTYLAIFLGVILVVGVFLHRWYILRKYGVEEIEVAQVIEENIEKEEKEKVITSQMRDEIDALCARGESYLKYGKDDEAIKCFVQALAIDEFDKETQHRLAMLYLKKEMYSAASALFKQLGDNTNDPIHYSHLGLSLYQQSDFEGALSAYQKAVDLDDTRANRFANLAQVYRSLGRLQHAIIAMNKAVEKDNQNIDNLFVLAEIQYELKNFEDAERICKGILDLDSNYSDAKRLLKELSIPRKS